MRETVKDTMGVKASGGIRTKADFDKMVEAGASRIGCSAGVKIMEESNNE
jgi:deoxyribose-phosphate aldolase